MSTLPPISTQQLELSASTVLTEAMDLLDPPPSRVLTASDVAIAYDLLLRSVATIASSTPSSSSVSLGREESYRGTFDPEWASLQADLHRALLLSSHLLLGMAPRLLAPGSDSTRNEAGEGREAPRPQLDEDDAAVLRRTGRRCRLLLRELAHVARVGGEAGIGMNDDDGDWHDDGLPQSRYQLLRECFERAGGEGADVDGTPRRLVPLEDGEGVCYDEEDYDGMAPTWEVCADARCGGGVPDIGEGQASFDEDENDDGGIDSVSFDRMMLESEEKDLLDIAFPSTSNSGNEKKKHKGKKRRRSNCDAKQFQESQDGSGSINKNQPVCKKHQGSTMKKEGFLVLVEEKKSELNRQAATTSGMRCHARLLKAGILIIEPTTCGTDEGGQLTPPNGERAMHTFCVTGECKCEPQSMGNTFHFRLDGMLRLADSKDICSRDSGDGPSHPQHCNGVSADRLSRSTMTTLVFKVDEETGGGLADGFGWVTALTEVSMVAASRRANQDVIRREWEDYGWIDQARRRVLGLAHLEQQLS